MANLGSGMSIDNPLGGEYQVFLSFSGQDTRRGITNSLYHALVDAGIRVFMDDEELRPGERIDGNLFRAIDDSKFYIPIFSKKYAFSHWCLRELKKMLDNISKSKEKENEKVILPIFYDVRPADVKLKTPVYNDAILELEQKMEGQERKFSSEEIKTWREALREVDGTKGWELKKYKGDGDLVEDVVNEVVVRLKTRQRKVTEDLVGMEDRVAAINSLLDIQSGGARLIGICGMGGIGKSTLAKIIYNQLCPRFGKNCSFLDGVRETAKTMGLVKLQEQLLSDVSNSRVARHIDNIDHGINTIRETICNKKVLVVLDDVDEENQIECLIGVGCLYPGTRILVTTRDKSVLKIRGLKYEIMPYEIEVLRDKDALQLFSRHAFDADFPPDDYNTLSKAIVSTTGGLPSALRAIGSLLFVHKDKNIWEEMLEKLKKTPNSDVLSKLRITYDALETDQQQIFLDVACFFIGKDKTHPVFAWKDCGFSPEYAIDVLTNRCTMKVLDNNQFWMHDQFRDLGWTIANQEHSRLWIVDDIIRELRSTEINRSVQALDLTNWSWTDNPITVTAEQIKRFPHLRMLCLHNVHCQGNFADYLSELKWISLFYPEGSSEHHPRFEATNLQLENVVVGNLVGHGFTDDHVRSLIKEGRKLKVFTLENSMAIYRTPTFSEFSVLEKLTISKCSSLMEIDFSIGKLGLLTDLIIESCQNLGKLPEQIGELRNLQNLCLKNCDSLNELPKSISQLVSLTRLDLSHTPITTLQDSITRLPSLSSLNVSSTPIAQVPSTMSKLGRLQTLDLEHCHKIQELPKLPSSLTTLRLRSSSLQTVPNLSNLSNLVELLLSDGSESKATSNIIQTCELKWIGMLSKLRKQQLCLLNVRAPPMELGSLSLLKELTMSGLDFQSIEQLPSNLTILELDRTQAKQVQLDGLLQLEKLSIRRCEFIKRLSIPSSLRKLREAEVSSCAELVEIHFLGDLIPLEGLCIDDCKSLERLVNLPEEPRCNELQSPELTNGEKRVSLVSSSLKMLQVFKLLRCPKLHGIQFDSALKPLGVFSIEECTSLKRIVGLSNLKNLTRFGLVGCENLQVVEGMDELKRLEQLKIDRCRSMERIDASSLKLPKNCQIQIRDCGGLLDTGPDGSSMTWESYREKILNGSSQASDSEIESTFYDCETETGDPLSEQQDDEEEDEADYKDAGGEINDDDDDGKEDVDENDDVNSSRGLSSVCSMDENDENDDVDKAGEHEGHSSSDSKEDEDEYDNREEDEDNGVHEICSADSNDENNDFNEEGDGDGYGYGNDDGNDDEDRNEDEEERYSNDDVNDDEDKYEHEEERDDDREDDEDNSVHEVWQSSPWPSPGCSVDGNVENNDFNEEGEGDGYGYGYGGDYGNDSEDEEKRYDEEAEEQQDNCDDYQDYDYDDGKEDYGDEAGDYNGEDDDGD